MFQCDLPLPDSVTASSPHCFTASDENDLDKTVWRFSMQLCDLQVRGPSDFPTLDAVEALAEFRDPSSTAHHVASGLRTAFLVFLRHFDDRIGHWHGPTVSLRLIYALLQLQIELTYDLLQWHTSVMTGHWQLLVFQSVLGRF
jgi:hypothetical protein